MFKQSPETVSTVSAPGRNRKTQGSRMMCICIQDVSSTFSSTMYCAPFYISVALVAFEYHEELRTRATPVLASMYRSMVQSPQNVP